MTRRYTYSRTISTPEGVETFTAQEWDSFDEAKNAVDKGVYDRMLFFKDKNPIPPTGGPVIAPVIPTVGDRPKTN